MIWMVISFTWWIPLVYSVPEHRNWCYSNSTSKTISCNDAEYMLEIVKAFAAVSRSFDDDFCEYPTFGSGHCMLGEDAQTDLYRKKCNGFSNCNFFLNNKPLNDCDGFYGSMYLHIEYVCHPISDNMRILYPVLDPCSSSEEATESSIVRLRSNGYPTTWQHSDQCHCSVRMEYNCIANINIRDMAHNDVNNAACPFYVMINDEKVCASRGMIFQGVDVTPTDADKPFKDIPLTFYSENFNVKGRYWIDIQIALQTGEYSKATVRCQNFGHGRLNSTFHRGSSPTSTQTTTPRTPSTSATTLDVEAATLTTTPATMASSTPTTSMKYVDSQEETQSTTTVSLGGNVTNTSMTSTTSISPSPSVKTSTSIPEVMEEALDIKIIVGGAAAGGVVVILIIVFLSVCLHKSSSKRKKKKGNDLGYSVHANVLIAQRQSRQRGRGGGGGGKTGKQTQGGSSVPPHYNGTLEHHQRVASSSQAKSHQHPSLPGHSYVNVPTPVTKHKATRHHQKKSTSQITLHFSSNESLNNAGLGDNNVFAGFPRWSEDCFTRGNEHTYANIPPGRSNTLPAKLNKRPMPLPKPLRHKSTINLARNPSMRMGRGEAGHLRSGGSSIQSLSQPDYDTARSTEPLYARKHGARRKEQRGIFIMENDMYGH